MSLLTIDEARTAVLHRIRRLPAESVSLAVAAGRVLAEDVHAVVDLPSFRSSSMDGYAVRAADAPGRLRVVERIAAGAVATRPLEPGEAMGIATGAPVPEGADAVVPIELVSEGGESIQVPSVSKLDNIRAVGGDVGRGSLLLEAGVTLGPAQVGALAAAGIGHPPCARRPRAAVLSTGSELRAPGERLGPGQIYEANAHMLAGLLASAGAEVELLEPVADDEHEHRRALERGLAADVLVTSGGVSVGPHDLVRRIAAELGVVEVFWRVAVRPGKPLAFGVRGTTLVFGLPGNPVSALVSALLFVLPALRALQGADPGPHYSAGRLAAAVRPSPDRDQLVRARSRADDGDAVLEPLSGQESHMIARAASADALVLVRAGAAPVAGDRVPYLRF